MSSSTDVREVRPYEGGTHIITSLFELMFQTLGFKCRGPDQSDWGGQTRGSGSLAAAGSQKCAGIGSKDHGDFSIRKSFLRSIVLLLLRDSRGLVEA